MIQVFHGTTAMLLVIWPFFYFLHKTYQGEVKAPQGIVTVLIQKHWYDQVNICMSDNKLYCPYNQARHAFALAVLLVD